MAAFGYGSTYQPSWRAQEQIQQNPINPNSAYSIAPAVSPPNWQPSANQPWADPGVQQMGTYTQWDTRRELDGRTGNYLTRDAWANPLGALSGITGLPQDNVTMGVNAYRDDFGERRNAPGQINVGQITYDRNQITNTKQLNERVNQFSNNDLQRLSGLSGGFQNTFAGVAQNYKNAYANKNYGSGQVMSYQGGTNGLNAGQYSNPLTETETMDYLQQSYDKLLTRMNNNYLL